MTRRWFISAALLAVQLIGLSHVCFAQHQVTGTGALVDAVELTRDEHDLSDAHICDGEQLLAPLPEECAVVANWRAPVLCVPSSALVVTPLEYAERSSVRAAAGVEPLAALVRAPKSSPPYDQR